MPTPGRSSSARSLGAKTSTAVLNWYSRAGAMAGSGGIDGGGDWGAKRTWARGPRREMRGNHMPWTKYEATRSSVREVRCGQWEHWVTLAASACFLLFTALSCPSHAREGPLNI